MAVLFSSVFRCLKQISISRKRKDRKVKSVKRIKEKAHQKTIFLQYLVSLIFQNFFFQLILFVNTYHWGSFQFCSVEVVCFCFNWLWFSLSVSLTPTLSLETPLSNNVNSSKEKTDERFQKTTRGPTYWCFWSTYR